MSTLRLHLVRHEEAAPADFGPDAHRPLTARGRMRLARHGSALAARLGPLDLLVTSPLVRAVQTAELMAAAFGVDEVAVEHLLASPPSLAALARLADDAPAPVRSLMLVGHEPSIGLLAAHLLGLPDLGRSVRTGSVFTLELERGHRPARLVCLTEPEGVVVDRWW